MKINKMPEFYMIPARKISQIRESLWCLPENNKIPEFYMPELYIIARQIFSDFFWGGARSPCPQISYAYVVATHAARMVL